MTKPRELPNVAIWAFEAIYPELLRIERLLAPIDNRKLSMGEIRDRAKDARLAASTAREHVVAVRPKAARKQRRRV